MLVANPGEHLDDLAAPRRPTVDCVRLDPIADVRVEPVDCLHLIGLPSAHDPTTAPRAPHPPPLRSQTEACYGCALEAQPRRLFRRRCLITSGRPDMDHSS